MFLLKQNLDYLNLWNTSRSIWNLARSEWNSVRNAYKIHSKIINRIPIDTIPVKITLRNSFRPVKNTFFSINESDRTFKSSISSRPLQNPQNFVKIKLKSFQIIIHKNQLRILVSLSTNQKRFWSLLILIWNLHHLRTCFTTQFH